ncbi:hypothetical protein EDC94DRAFT_614759 [Helicostylum pulchrum]|nr:hypothetical protein EDC94DRAFT_614759 [Helicostylum pulchrum]
MYWYLHGQSWFHPHSIRICAGVFLSCLGLSSHAYNQRLNWWVSEINFALKRNITLRYYYLTIWYCIDESWSQVVLILRNQHSVVSN